MGVLSEEKSGKINILRFILKFNKGNKEAFVGIASDFEGLIYAENEREITGYVFLSRLRMAAEI